MRDSGSPRHLHEAVIGHLQSFADALRWTLKRQLASEAAHRINYQTRWVFRQERLTDSANSSCPNGRALAQVVVSEKALENRNLYPTV